MKRLTVPSLVLTGDEDCNFQKVLRTKRVFRIFCPAGKPPEMGELARIGIAIPEDGRCFPSQAGVKKTPLVL
jgi:hypothetical protein